MNWPIKKLGDVLQISRGGSPRPIENYITEDKNGLNWIKIGDVQVGAKYITHTKEKIRQEGLAKTRQVKVGDFLLSNSMSFGRPYITKIDGCIHDGWLSLRDEAKIFNTDFLYHVLNSNAVKDQFIKYASGAVVKNLNIDAVSKVVVAIPPLAEQQRIAALLDTADRILKLRESAIVKLDQLAQSVFLNELRAYDFSSFQLAEVAEMYQPKTISANELIENGEYVVYGANGVIGRYDKFNHSDSEVLITCRGATCGTVNRSQPLAWITGNAMVVKPLNNIATKDFLHYYFKFVADFSSVITGAAQPQITRQTLSRLMIQLPKLENQNKITIVVREIYKKHELMNLSKNKLQELTSALQHQSFAVN